MTEERNIVYNIRTNVDAGQLERLIADIQQLRQIIAGLSSDNAQLSNQQSAASAIFELMHGRNAELAELVRQYQKVIEIQGQTLSGTIELGRSLVPLSSGYQNATRAAQDFYNQVRSANSELQRQLLDTLQVQMRLSQGMAQSPLMLPPAGGTSAALGPMYGTYGGRPPTIPPIPAGWNPQFAKWTGSEWLDFSPPPSMLPPSYPSYVSNQGWNVRPPIQIPPGVTQGAGFNMWPNAGALVPIGGAGGGPPSDEDVIDGLWRALGGGGGTPPGGTPPGGTPPAGATVAGGGGWAAWLNDAVKRVTSGWAAGGVAGGQAKSVFGSFGAGMSAGIGSGNFSGGGVGGFIGSLGGALGGFMSIPGITELIAALSLLTVAVNGLLSAYREGNAYLQGISATRKETGVPPQEAADLRALFSTTPYGGMGQFLGQMVFQQVQANLQNVADYKAGLIQLNPIQERFNHSLEEMGVSATDVNGNVKSLVPFTLELSAALHKVLETDPGRYAQVVQGVGNMFGRLYSSLVGTDPALLQQALDGAVRVNQKLLDQTDERTVATNNAVQAEKELEIVWTRLITPVDMVLQKIKQIGLSTLSAAAMPQQDASAFLGGILGNAKMSPLMQSITGKTTTADLYSSMMQGILNAMLNNIPNFVASGNLAMGVTTPDQINRQNFPGSYDQKTLDKIAQDAKTYQKEVAKGVTADYNATVKEYTRTLDDMTQAITRATTAQASQFALNDKGISSFDSLMDKVMSTAKSYDSWYQSYRSTQEKIDELEKKRDTVVEQMTINGRPISGGAKKVMDLAFKFQELGAESTDEKANLEKQNADLSAAYQDIQGKKRVSAATQNRINDLLANIARGGTTAKEKVIDERQLWDLQYQAQQMGFQPGEAITTENLKSVWAKQGLSPADTATLADMYEKLKQLREQDKESQLSVTRTGVEQYLSNLSQKVKEGTLSEKDFADASAEMVNQLDAMAQSAGLFQSTGFSRAIAEAALAAKLSAGDFGKGAEGIKNYVATMQGLHKDLADLESVLSGTYNITPEQAEAAGILKPYSTAAEDALKAAGQMAKMGEGEVSGTVAGAAIAESAQNTLRQRILDKQVTSGEILGMIFQKWNVDARGGIRGVADVSINMDISAAQKKADEAKEYFDKVFANAYDLNITFDGMTPQQMKDLLTEIKQHIQDTNQLPPARVNPLNGRFFDPGTGSTYGAGPVNFGQPPPQFLLGEGVAGNGNLLVGGKPAALYGDAGVTAARLATSGLADLLQEEANRHPIEPPATFDPQKEFDSVLPQVNAFIDMLKKQLRDIPLHIRATVDAAGAFTGAGGGTGAGGTDQGGVGNTGTGTMGPGGTGFSAGQGRMNTGGQGKYVPNEAGGGPVYRGLQYLVGEEGGRGELFSPYSDGEILNATMTQRLVDAMQSYNGGLKASYVNSVMVNNTVHVDARGSTSPAQAERAVRRAASAIFMSDDWRYAQRQERRRGGLQ